MVMKLKELFYGTLSESELQLVVRAYDLVGDIVIMTIPRELEEKEKEIASAILAKNHKVKVVAKRAAHYGGEFRSRPVKIIGGEVRRETEVKEFGVRLQLDVEKVYFSVRSGNERRRIASLVQGEENVLVPFSGIGPYPLMISRYSRAKRIVGIEKNPAAHNYGLINLKLNKKWSNIELIKGDIRDVLPGFTAKFDRIIMPLPKSAGDYIHLVLPLLQPGGWVHFYDMQHIDSFEKSVIKVRAACEAAGRSLVTAEIVLSGHCGPRTYRICVDALLD
jgi:tRNA (guanine37-N1)-methyltransferase